MRGIGLERGDVWDPLREAAALVAVTWLVTMTLACIDWALERTPAPLLSNIALHARLLVSVPLFVLAEHNVHRRTERCIQRFTAGGFAGGETVRLARSTHAAAAMRDSAVAELVLALLALGGSVVVTSGPAHPLGIGVHSGAPSSLAVMWYSFVARPIFQFLVYRWAWRWVIWIVLLWRLSRLTLAPAPTHPDRAGGMRFLAEPALGFAFMWLAIGAAVSGVWANLIIFDGVRLTAFSYLFAALVLLALVLTFGPLLFFVWPLAASRFAARREYDALALSLVRAMHERWIEGERRDGILAARDFSAWADLASGYSILRTMRLVPFGVTEVAIVAAAVAVPVLPLLLTEVPLQQLVEKAIGILAGTVLR